MRHSWNDPHILRTVKSLLKALYLTCGVFIAFFVLFHIGSAFYVSHISENETTAFQAGIAHDIAYLKAQGDEIARNETLIGELLAGNRENLLQTLDSERAARSIGLMSVTDSEGVVVGRTLTKGKYGDNVFLTLPVGRVVAQGKSVESIELTSWVNQLYMTTARPLMRNESMVGALFASYLLDDTYAARFRGTYLSRGAEVVFYTKTYGVYGDSFVDQATRSLITSYFNTGSDWIKQGSSDKTVSLGNGTTYLVKNIVFPGLEQSPGGALVFIPRRDLSEIANIVTAFFTLLAFVLFALREHARTPSEERGWRYYCLLISAAVPVFGLTFFALHAQNLGRLYLEHVSYTLYNSTIRLQPEFGIYTVGSEQQFSVVVDTGDESINVVQLKLHFDPQAVEIKSLNTATSTCSYVVEKSIDQASGTAVLVCGILDPEQGQRSIPIVTVVVTPKRAGTFRISFDQAETEVLAADGLGTNVLRMSQDGSYRADNFSLFSDPGSTSTSTALSFVIFSPTHPNESRWYDVKKAHFVWRGKPDAVYRYDFDTSPATTPSNEHTIQGSTVDVSIPGDGIYYFHLQLASGGPIAHYRIQSDMTPPTILGMKLSQENVFAGDVVRFSFDAEDPVSGIQRNYYVDLGGRLFLPVGSQLFIPFLEAGEQPVTLRVYDGAGNYSEKTQVVHVEGK